MSAEEIVNEELEAWSRQAGGGMIPFDTAYFLAVREGKQWVDATQAGVKAALDAFAERLRVRL